MADPNPVRPRLKDAKKYERLLRTRYVDPMFVQLGDALARVAAINQAYHALRDVVRKMEALPVGGVPVDEIQKHLLSLEGYHRAQLIKSFRSALGVNIVPYLTRPEVAAYMTRRIGENVDLIRTIPRRMHDSLRLRMRETFTDAPFDRQRMRGLLRDEYRSTGYNLRRLTRDQNSKMVGQLTKMRQSEVGITHYRWLTSQDGRVRPSHRNKSGLVFSWSDPPADTGHPGEDVMCRCVGRAIVDQAIIQKLRGAGPHSLIQ